MSIRFASLLALAIALFASPAHALIEGRLTYGFLASKPNLTDLYNGTLTDIPSAVPSYGLGGDLLVQIPLTGLGFGLRYENLGLKASGGGLDFETKANRTALLVSYRLIDTILHIGPIFSYGLSHSNAMTVSQNGSQRHDWQPDSASSYQIGLEAGAGLAGLIIGGELGFQSMKWNSMTDKTGTSTTKPTADMSGTYAKVFVGFSI